MSTSEVTVYPTAQDRHEAVQRARDRRMDAFAALESALEAGDHAAARAANDEYERVANAYRRLLCEQWRVVEERQ